MLILGWAALLTAGLAVGGLAALGTLLTAAFVLQVTPQLWTAYRTARPTGISRGTWSLVLGELSCWAAFGLHRADYTLVVLGFFFSSRRRHTMCLSDWSSDVCSSD